MFWVILKAPADLPHGRSILIASPSPAWPWSLLAAVRENFSSSLSVFQPLWFSCSYCFDCSKKDFKTKGICICWAIVPDFSACRPWLVVGFWNMFWGCMYTFAFGSACIPCWVLVQSSVLILIPWSEFLWLPLLIHKAGGISDRPYIFWFGDKVLQGESLTTSKLY